ncbi:MAG: hypothetical protein Q9163_002072 [Psora crenata]
MTPDSLRGMSYLSCDSKFYTKTEPFPPSEPHVQGTRYIVALQVEDGKVKTYVWAHNSSYAELDNFIKRGRSWRESVFESASVRWRRAAEFRELYSIKGETSTERRDKDVQPSLWDQAIKGRDKEESRAIVGMWWDPERMGEC